MTAPKTVQATSACPSTEEIRQYLTGWLHDDHAEQIEQHASECSVCGEILNQQDLQPDTLMQALQATVAQPATPKIERLNHNAVHSKSPAFHDADQQLHQDSDGDSINTPRGKNWGDDHTVRSDLPINAALAKAKRLMDAPVETAADKAKAAWQPAQRELGMYELIKPLGRGGMGAVYLAIHKQLKKQVAIKLLPMMSSEDSDVRARFDREIRVVGKLNHPSIVAATDAGEIDGTQFLVMEYVPGLDLSRLARLLGKLPIADACELMRQVALGLSCAHAEGVVHRDVKPSNLMLDESGRIRILDFGLAQLSVWDEASVDLTTVGQLMGTLDYMAPEQAEFSGSVDYRADLYAMGATLFRLLCGRPPLAAAPNQSPLEKLRMLANHQSPKLDTLCPDAHADLVKLVASLLSRSPQDRPASAAHVAEQLAPFAEGSKLVELLQQAKEKAATSPELLRKTAFPDHPPFLSPALASLAPRPTSSGGRRSKIVRRLLLAASLPLLIIAGILIRLELNKGQLVIESDVADVAVKLLKDGKPVDGIQVSHGTTSTRLQADNYEITIDGPSDGLVIDNDKFTLKNGETVVARITRTPDSSNSAVAEAVRPAGETATFNTFADPVQAMKHKLDELSVECELQRQKLGDDHPRLRELEYEIKLRSQFYELAKSEQVVTKSPPTESALYDGQPLEHWLDMLSRETGKDGIRTALRGCHSLITAENSSRVTNAVLGMLSTRNFLDGFTFDPNFENLAIAVLETANPGQAFYAMSVEHMDDGNEILQRRLRRGLRIADRKSWQDVAPFVSWAEQKLNPVLSKQPNETELKIAQDDAEFAADMLLVCLSEDVLRSDEKETGAVSQILVESTAVSATWWLGQPLFSSDDDGNTVPRNLPKMIRTRMIENAVSALRSDTTEATLVAQASLMLSQGDVLDNQQTKVVLDVIERRLEQVLGNDNQLSQVVRIPKSLSTHRDRSIDTLSPVFVREIIWRSRASDVYYEFVTLCLLSLAQNIDQGETVRPQLDQLVITWDPILKVCAGLHKNTQRYEVNVSLPELSVVSASSQEMASFFNAFPETRYFSPQDWTKVRILQHPLMTPSVKAALKTQSPVDAAEMLNKELTSATQEQTGTDPTPTSGGALYNGKPLEHWLDMLSRERSAVGLKSAFEGCTALVKEENAGAITDALLKVLPGLTGDLQVTDKEMNRVWTLDYAAGDLLRKANPGSNFFEVWVKARSQSTDKKWNERLLKLAIHRKPESADDLTPLIQWARSVLLEADDSGNTDQNEKSQAVDDAAILLRGFVATNSLEMNASFVDSVVPILVESPKLDDRWWLSHPLVGSNDANLWPPPIKDEITRVAVDAIENDDTSPSLVAQACMVLSHGADLTPEQRERVLTSVSRRLSQLCAAPDSWTDMVQANDSFSNFGSVILVDSPLSIVRVEMAFRYGWDADKPVNESSLLLEMLTLVVKLDGTASVQPQLDLIMTETQETFEIIHAQNYEVQSKNRRRFNQPGGPRSPHVVKLHWPALAASDASPQGFAPSIAGPQGSIQLLWGDHQPSKRDWLEYLILNHPAMKDTVAGAMEKLK